MDKNRKEHLKEFVRKMIGWIYSDLLWLSDEEAQLADEQRNRLVAELSGWGTFSFKGSKVHAARTLPAVSSVVTAAGIVILLIGSAPEIVFTAPKTAL